MNLAKAIVLNILVMSACSAPPELTQRDVAEQIGATFCTRSVECGYLAPEKLDECIRHNTFHLCEVDLTCDIALTPEESDALAQCAEELALQECPLIYWGIVPEVCQPLL